MWNTNAPDMFTNYLSQYLSNVYEMTEGVICPTCDYEMISIQACHEKCFNCGAELVCSDN